MKLSKDFVLSLLISVLAFCLFFLILPLLAIGIFGNSRIPELGVFEAWNIWDGPHYLDIADNWYVPGGEKANWIVFLPLYPIVVSGVNFIFRIPILYAGYFVSFLSALGSALIFYRLLLIDEKKEVSLLAVLTLFIFPTSFFLFLPYPESIFLLLVLLTFYNLRKGHFLLASFFAMLATSAKIVGLALIPVIFLELTLHHIKLSTPLRLFKAILILNLPVLGFLFYLLINYLTFGDLFYFMRAQDGNWGTNFYPVVPGFKQAISFALGSEFEMKVYLGFGQIIAFLLMVFTTIYSHFKLRRSYFIFSLAFLVVYSSMSYWLSYPRYLLSLFPMFIILGRFCQNRLFLIAWGILSVGLLFLFGIIALKHGIVL